MAKKVYEGSLWSWLASIVAMSAFGSAFLMGGIFTWVLDNDPAGVDRLASVMSWVGGVGMVLGLIAMYVLTRQLKTKYEE